MHYGAYAFAKVILLLVFQEYKERFDQQRIVVLAVLASRPALQTGDVLLLYFRPAGDPL